MIIKKASQVGEPVIRTRAKRVSDMQSKDVQKTIKDLTDSMRHHGLVGMAAPQIGRGERIFVTEIRKTKSRTPDQLDPLRVFINPKIVERSKKEIKGWEGCGSVAATNLFGVVKRPYSVTVEAYDENGEKFSLKTSGLLARVIQHETDHLNGTVFTDKADVKTFMSKESYLNKG